MGQKYQVRYTQKGQSKVYIHEGHETKGRLGKEIKDAQDQHDISIFNKKARPRYTQPTILYALLKIRKQEQPKKGGEILASRNVTHQGGNLMHSKYTD